MMAWRRPLVSIPADHGTAHRDALEDCLLPMTCQPGGRVKDENSPRSIASSIFGLYCHNGSKTDADTLTIA